LPPVKVTTAALDKGIRNNNGKIRGASFFIFSF
jgi:hypothetical protein